MSTLPFLADDEVAALCEGLEQPAAQVKYLRGLGLRVERKPNGRPLLMRSELERVLGASRMQPANDAGGKLPPAVFDLSAMRRVNEGGKRGPKAQGR